MKPSVFYHLKEAQLRPVYLFLSFGFCFLASYHSSEEILHLLTKPLLPLGKDLIFTDLTEGFYTTLKISVSFASTLTFPFLVYQSWAFFAPSWYRYERDRYRLNLSLSLLFLGGGGLSAYFLLLPKGSEYLFGFSILNQPLSIDMELKVGSYVSFALSVFLVGLFLGQVPLLLSFCLGFCKLDHVVDYSPCPSNLEEKKRNPFSLIRKTLFLFSLLLASFLGPADFLLQLLLTGLFLFLFEGGIYLFCFYNRYLRASPP